MTPKRNVVLYLDRELAEKTKELGFNLSKTVENHLKQLITQFSHVNTQNNSESSVFVGSPGEIRTLVGWSKAQTIQNQAYFVISDIDWAVSDFWQYCKIEERLSVKVSRDYKNVSKKFLLSCNGEVSRRSIRDFLEPYLSKAPKTYNIIIDGSRAFIERYLHKKEHIEGFKHSHVPSNYERDLPTKEQLKRGFEALDSDKERAIYLFFATTGLRRSEIWNLTKDNVDFELRCVKAKHDTRTKRAGVTFYNEECEVYLARVRFCRYS